MTPEQERWAEALQVLKMKGVEASSFVAERIATLATAGASDGVSRWREIEARLLILRSSDGRRQ